MKAIKNNVQCPVSFETADENAIRIAAGITFIASVAALYFKNPLILLILGFDFSLRALTNGKASIIKQITKFLAIQFRLNKKPVDAAPKKFAAGLGMVFCFLTAALLFLELDIAALIAGGALSLCAFLESGFAFCVGCLVYTYTVIPFMKQS